VRNFLTEFRKFIMRGNIIDLAVAVILGVAFNAVVQSLVNDVITPLIGAIVGKPDFRDLTLEIGDGVVRYGAFITEVANFLIIGFSVFLIIKTFEKMQSLRRSGAVADTPAPSDEAVLLTEIRDLLATQRGS
jgi:large conductance mechanosensitive channel